MLLLKHPETVIRIADRYFKNPLFATAATE